MQKNSTLRVILMWFFWAAILIGFQALVAARYSPDRPDRVLSWTASLTTEFGLADQPYLTDPFMNDQVSWDSDMYLSIAVNGYSDPNVQSFQSSSGKLPLNYAFFPLYPYLIRILAYPLKVFHQTPIGTATLAGVLISLLGTLGGMLALHDIARRELGDSGGLRAAFYLLIFPTGFFLAQVYTEGLFIGLAFGSMALLYRKKWVWAAVTAVLATWTRSVGVALAIPLAIAWLQEVDWKNIKQQFTWKNLGKGLLVLAPLGAYGLWRSSELGRIFQIVEDEYFGRGLLQFSESWEGWRYVFTTLHGENHQTAIYFGLELAIIALSFIACLFTVRKHPGPALFGLAVLVVSVTLGFPQSISRYLLVLPTTFIFLSRLGRNEVFDRAWTLLSLLIMGMQVTLFTFNFWVA